MQAVLHSDEDAAAAAVGGETLADWLAVARAQAQADLGLGFAAATRAWEVASSQGQFSEYLEAGRWRCFYMYRRGEMAGMLAAAQQLMPAFREQGSSASLCELLRWMAFAAAEMGDFESALAHVNETLARARELAEPKLVALALNAVGAVLERMGDPWQAERLMNEAAALVAEQAGPTERLIAHNNLATVGLSHYKLLRHSQSPEQRREGQDALSRALQHTLAARPHGLAVGECFVLAISDSNRGEILLHLGRLDEAEAVLHEALADIDAHGYLGLGWRARCSLAELQLARGDAAGAAQALAAVLAESAGRAQSELLMRLHHAAYRATQALGDAAQALHHLEQHLAVARSRAVAQLAAQARFFVTRVEAERSLEERRPPPANGREAAVGSEVAEPPDASWRDPLTGLGNRECMAARMPALVRAAELTAAPLTLALIDVDRFTALTRQHGLDVGNQVLQVLAQMLRDNTRARDLLLRLADDQILVALPDTVADRAVEVCERLRSAVELYPWSQLAEGLDVTLSIGLANAPPYATDLLVARAESAMYRAKHLGRNRVALA
jgi:diguanylate cyclase (GGDEF)-like protein